MWRLHSTRHRLGASLQLQQQEGDGALQPDWGPVQAEVYG